MPPFVGASFAVGNPPVTPVTAPFSRSKHQGVPKMKMSSAVLAAFVAASVAATLPAQVKERPLPRLGKAKRSVRLFRRQAPRPDVGPAGAQPQRQPRHAAEGLARHGIPQR